MKNSLVLSNHYKFSLFCYFYFAIKLSLKLAIDIVCDRYIPGGKVIMQNPHTNYLRMTKAEKDEFVTKGSVINCSIVKSRPARNFNTTLSLFQPFR